MWWAVSEPIRRPRGKWISKYIKVHSKFRITNQSAIKIPMKSDMKDALVLGNKLLVQGRG